MHATGLLGKVVRLLVVTLAASGAAACDVVLTSLDAKGKAQDQWSRTYTVAPGGLVEILNTNGEIDVAGGTSGRVEVVAERTARGMTDEDARKLLGQLQIAEDLSPSRVRLETKAPSGEMRHVDVKYHVKVPAGISVRLENTNGGVEVTAVTGAVKAETTNGTVRGRDLAGAVEATTTNGAVRLDVREVAPGGIRAETVNGLIELTMPASAKADVDANCLNGRISIEGIKLDGPEPTRRHVAGRLNGGGPRVALDATNGKIQLTGK